MKSVTAFGHTIALKNGHGRLGNIRLHILPVVDNHGRHFNVVAQCANGWEGIGVGLSAQVAASRAIRNLELGIRNEYVRSKREITRCERTLARAQKRPPKLMKLIVLMEVAKSRGNAR